MSDTQQRPRRFDTYDALTAGLVALLMAAAFEVARNGPVGPIAVHFNLVGRPNGWGDRTTVALLIVGVGVLTALINIVVKVAVGPSPQDDAQRRTAGILRGGAVAMGGALALIFASLALSPSSVDTGGRLRLVTALTWLILIGLGAVVGKAAPNPILGVRTFWTFRSRLAWDKSNRLLGRIYFLGGLLGLLITPLIDFGASFSVSTGLTVLVAGGGAIAAVYESWRVWKTDPERIV